MAHAQGINGQTLKEFLEKLGEDGYAAAGRAHTQVTKSLWTPKEKEIARKAIAEHYGAPKVAPPKPAPKPSSPAGTRAPSQWARAFVKPTTPEKTAKPAPKRGAKLTKAEREAKRLEKIAYQREWRAKRSAALRRADTIEGARAALDALGPRPEEPKKAPPFVAGSIARLETVPAMLLDRLSARVESLEHQRTVPVSLEPLQALQRALLDLAEASKVDKSLLPELHRVGRCIARMAVFVTDAMTGPEDSPRGRGRPRKASPTSNDETMPAPMADEETVSLPFDLEEGPESMAAE